MMNENGHAEESPVMKAARQLGESIYSITIDPKAMVVAALGRVATQSYPTPARAAQAALLIQSLEAPVRELLYQWNLPALRTLLYNFERDARMLTIPPPVPTFAENLAGHLARMNELGWTSLECEALRRFASETDRILSFDVNCCSLASGRTVSRTEIRETLRPAWQPIDEWHETREYQSMVRAHEDSIAAERARNADQAVKYSSGPARVIGKVA